MDVCAYPAKQAHAQRQGCAAVLLPPGLFLNHTENAEKLRH